MTRSAHTRTAVTSKTQNASTSAAGPRNAPFGLTGVVLTFIQLESHQVRNHESFEPDESVNRHNLIALRGMQIPISASLTA